MKKYEKPYIKNSVEVIDVIMASEYGVEIDNQTFWD